MVTLCLVYLRRSSSGGDTLPSRPGRCELAWTGRSPVHVSVCPSTPNSLPRSDRPPLVRLVRLLDHWRILSWQRCPFHLSASLVRRPHWSRAACTRRPWRSERQRRRKRRANSDSSRWMNFDRCWSQSKCSSCCRTAPNRSSKSHGTSIESSGEDDGLKLVDWSTSNCRNRSIRCRSIRPDDNFPSTRPGSDPKDVLEDEPRLTKCLCSPSDIDEEWCIGRKWSVKKKNH